MKTNLLLRSRRGLLDETILKLFQRYWFHVLIWVLMLAYLFFAPSLYARFFLKEGRPVKVAEGRPVDSNQIKFMVEGLGQSTQDIYVLSGWASSFSSKTVSPDMYDRKIVLISDKKTYFFPIETLPRQDVQDVFKNLNMDLVRSGFRVSIARDAIQSGKYRIGIIFTNPDTGLSYFSDKPARFIVRSPNTLSYKK